MSTGADMAEIAALVGDPARANMLAALLGGRALTAGELAGLAGVTPATASGHLAKLACARLVAPEPQGRRRYYRLASPDAARMLEAILAVAAEAAPATRRATPRIPPELRHARVCYDHLAGRLGVELADALAGYGWIRLADGAGEITPAGQARLTELGVRLERAPGSRRAYCRACLDWSERRPHLAGVLGAALLNRFFEKGWLARRSTGRALDILPEGRRGLRAAFGLET